MKTFWCDVETTGLETNDSGVFEVACICVYGQNGASNSIERVFYMNPFDIPYVKFHESAYEIHGVSQETIENFAPSKEVLSEMQNFLKQVKEIEFDEKLHFAGYNCGFDFKHLKAMFDYWKLDFDVFFEPKLIDVFEQVKAAGKARILPYLPNRKLTTIAKALNVKLDNAHDAMNDIRATKDVAKALYLKGVKLF